MRFLLYNMRYGTGGKPFLFPWSGYLRKTGKNLGEMVEFVKGLAPDVVGLVEVDAGSYRSDNLNQAQIIGDALGHYHIYRSKYGERHIAHAMPMLNKQGNAFLTRDTIHREEFHYFTKGMKRLVIELELENLTIFLVHLALSFRVRHHQLTDLYDLVKDTGKPHIVAGDFNALWGEREMNLFMAATGLCSAGPRNLATFPSWAPKRSLDFILHSPGIRIQKFWAPRVTFSDHLPLVCDFELEQAEHPSSQENNHQ
jgi:endonuclease/exonuclease/phosphatase family metal-dependent hydrolase